MDLIQAREIFRNTSTTQICDANKNVRVLSCAIKSFIARPKMLGLALTVQSDGDLLPGFKSLELATPDHVIVIDSEGCELALAGEMFASEGRRKQIAGIVIDGYCRDAAAISQIGLPFYAKGTCPKAAGKNKLGLLNVSIQCGGIDIQPNDIVIGDEEGIVVLPQDELFDTLRAAEAISQKEIMALEKINRGVSVLEIMNFAERYAEISAKNKNQ